MKRLFFKRNAGYIEEDEPLILFIKNIFGFVPGNIFLYRQALRHKSAAIAVKEGVKNSNERLEFLGDAVLGVIVADYLFKKFPFREEGFLTETRSKIVSRVSLGKLALKLDLGKHVVTSPEVNRNASGTILGDAMEALIGAIYIDKGFQFTQQTIIRYLLDIHMDIDEIVETEVNFKSRLIEHCQQEKWSLEFRMAGEVKLRNQMKQHRIELVVNDKVIAEAIDNSIKGAEQRAAEKGLKVLGIHQGN